MVAAPIDTPESTPRHNIDDEHEPMDTYETDQGEDIQDIPLQVS